MSKCVRVSNANPSKSDGVASLIQTSVDSIVNIKYIAHTCSNTKTRDEADIVSSDEVSEFMIKFHGLGHAQKYIR